MADASVPASLAAVKRQAETARSSLSRVPLGPHVPAEETADRLAAAATDLEYLRQAISASLGYSAITPVALPPVAGHIPEFLRTRPEPTQDEAEAAALGAAREMESNSSSSSSSNSSRPPPSPAAAAAAASHEYNSAVRRMAERYAAAARTTLGRVQAMTTSGSDTRSGGDGSGSSSSVMAEDR